VFFAINQIYDFYVKSLSRKPDFVIIKTMSKIMCIKKIFRMEVLNTKPLLIADGAHTPASVKRALLCFKN